MRTEPVIEVRKIEPWEAQLLLDSVPDFQRKRSQSYVDRYASDMSAGNWSLGSDLIVLTEPNGLLINGQHRMAAVVQAGVPVEFAVMVVPDGDAPRLFGQIDQGKPRSLTDYLQSRGEAQPATRAAIISAVWRFDQSQEPVQITRGGWRPSPAQLSEWTESNPPVDEAVSVARKLKRSLGGVSLHGALCYIWSRDISAESLDFWHQVATGETEYRSGAWHLRDRLLRQSGTPVSTPLAIRAAEAIFAFNAHREGREMKLMRVTPSMPFPDWRL